ncbi:hypothetical protein P7H06_25535 [Paenibacillus larvae]|nr:hypothetical protein [Paenibacillus larvae]MDT2262180.1 hypothetical protein [Paenibacillus larvae]
MGVSALGAALPVIRRHRTGGKVDLTHAKELQDKAKTVRDLTTEYDSMRNLINLTNPELMFTGT